MSLSTKGLRWRAERKAILKDLEERQQSATKLADEHDTKIKSVNKILAQLKEGKYEDFVCIICKRCVCVLWGGGDMLKGIV